MVRSCLPTHARAVVVIALTLLAVAGPQPRGHAAVTVPRPEIVPRSQWADASCPASTNPLEAASRIVVHHTHRPVAADRDDVVNTLRRICARHQERGFQTVGYHFAVDPWGRTYQLRGHLPSGEDAPRHQPEGAHVAGSNPGAVGVVFIGDHESRPPTTRALEAATALIAWLSHGMGLPPEASVTAWSTGNGTAAHPAGRFEVAAISGHSHSNTTACPGEHLEALLPGLRQRVAAVRAGTAPEPWYAHAVDGAQVREARERRAAAAAMEAARAALMEDLTPPLVWFTGVAG